MSADYSLAHLVPIQSPAYRPNMPYLLSRLAERTVLLIAPSGHVLSGYPVCSPYEARCLVRRLRRAYPDLVASYIRAPLPVVADRLSESSAVH